MALQWPCCKPDYPVCSKPHFSKCSQDYPVCSKPNFPTCSEDYAVCSKPNFPTCSEDYAVCSKPNFSTCSQVLIDGKLCLRCKHRISISQEGTIGISGELNMDTVNFQGSIDYAVCSKPNVQTCSQIRIQCEAHCCKVAMNGHQQFDYNHRICNLHNVNHLEVDGDLTLTNNQG